MNPKILTNSLFVTVLCTAATAQERGILAPAQSAMVITDASTPASAPTTIMRKKAGDTSLLSALVPDGTSPDYSIEALFDIPSAIADAFRIDAMSSGNDIIPRNEYDQLAGDVRWAVLAFSITKDSGAAPGSYLDQVSQTTTRGAGGEIMGYYVDESAIIPEALWDDTRFEQGAKSFGMATATDVEVSAFDLAMPVIVSRQGQPFEDPVFVTHEYVYLSLTNAATADSTLLASQVILDLNFDLNASSPGSSINGATIFRLRWNGTDWVDPKVIATSTTLDLDPAEDVDALAVHHGEDFPKAMIFSTVRDAVSFPDTPQLQIVSGLTASLANANPIPLETIVDGQPVQVVDRVGVRWEATAGQVEIGDPDALCVYDPGFDGTVIPLGSHVGQPSENPAPIGAGPEFELAAAKEIVVPGVDESVVIHASGMAGTAGGSIALSFRGLLTGGAWASLGVESVPPRTHVVEWPIPILRIPGLYDQPYDFKVDFASSDTVPIVQSSWVTSIIL